MMKIVRGKNLKKQFSLSYQAQLMGWISLMIFIQIIHL